MKEVIVIILYFLVSFVGSAINYKILDEPFMAGCWFIAWAIYIPMHFIIKLWYFIAE